MKPRPLFLMLTAGLLLGGCANIPRDAFVMPPDALAKRQLQSRSFEGVDEPAMLAACTGIFQDLGFTIDDSDTTLGVIVASKERSAVNKVQVAAAVAVGVMNIIWDPFFQNMTYVKRQVVQASLVTRMADTEKGRRHVVRVTFQRRVYDNKGKAIAFQKLDDPALYSEFYNRLARSVKLEEQIL